MAVVDKRIVEMVFKNKDFESKAQKSMQTIDKLKESTKFDQSASSIDAIAQSVQKLQDRFSNVGIIGKRALENITDTAMNMAGKVSGFLTSSVVGGGVRRAMNLENARFTMMSLYKDSDKVKDAMDNVSASVDGTAYSLDQAALVATQFTGAGVEVGDQLTRALKGLAGTAATYNADYASLGNIFASVASAGRVYGDDLLQLSTRGMPAAQVLADFFNNVAKGDESIKDVPDDIKQLTKSIAETSDKVSDATNVTAGEIKELVSQGKINFDIFSEAMFTTFGENAAKANETFSGSLANIKSALGRIGAGFVEPLVVQNGPIVNMFNAIREQINKVKKGLVFDAELGNTEALSKRVTDFIIGRIEKLTSKVQELDIDKLLTAFYNGVDGIVNVFKVLGDILRPIREAFREVFPKKTEDDIVSISEKFLKFTQNLSISKETISNIKDIFKGFFSLLDTGKTVIFGFINTFGPVFLEVAKRVLSFVLELGAAFGRFFQDIRKFVGAIVESLKFPTDEVTGLPKKIASEFADSPAFKTVLGILTTFRDGIQSILNSFRGVDRSGVSETADGITKDFSVLDTLLSGIESFANGVKKVFNKIKEILSPIATWIHDIFHDAVDEFKIIIAKIDTAHTTSMVLNGGLAFILTQIGQAIKNIGRGFASGGGIGKSISSMLESIGGALKNIKAYMNAKTLKLIADAILELVAAIFILALIPEEDAMRGLLTILGIVGVLKLIMSSVKQLSTGLIDSASMALIGATMLELSAAILVAVASVVVLAFIGYDNIVKGLFAISMICLLMTKTLQSITKSVSDSSWKGIFGAAALIAAASGAILAIVGAITVLSLIAKFAGADILFVGIAAIAAIALVLTMSIEALIESVDDVSIGDVLKTVISVMTITTALISIATATSMLSIILGLIPQTVITRGLLTLGVIVLATMALCVLLLEGFEDQSVLKTIKAVSNYVLIAGAIVLVATAMLGITSIIGLIPTEILTGGLLGMALIVGALMIFYLEMTKIGEKMKLTALLKTIVKLALVISVTTALFGGLLLMALAIGAVIKVLGSLNILEVSGFILSILGVILVGALLSTKIPRFSKGLEAMANVLVKLSKAFVLFSTGAKLLISALVKLRNLTDKDIEKINKNLVNLFEGIKNVAPVVVETIFVILSSLVQQVMDFLLTNIPIVVANAIDAVINSLKEIVNRIPEILTMFYEVFYNVVETLRPMLGDIVNELILLLIDLINALANAIDKNTKPILDAVDRLIDAIVKLVVEALGRLFGQNHKDISKWLNKHKTILRNFVKWFGLALAGLKIIGIMKKLGSVLSVIKTIIAKAKTIQIGTSGVQAATEAISSGPLAKVKELNSYFGGHGILVGSIAAFAIAGALAVKHFVDSMEVVDQQTKDMQEEAESMKTAYKEAFDKATTESEEFRDSLSKNVSAEDAEWQETQILKDELDKLVDSHGKVKTGSEELARSIVLKLNDALGTNYDIVDGQITKNGKLVDSYDEVSAAIDKTLAKMRAADTLESTKADYTEAKKFLNDTANTTRYNELKYGDAIEKAKESYKELDKLRTNLFTQKDYENDILGYMENMTIGRLISDDVNAEAFWNAFEAGNAKGAKKWKKSIKAYLEGGGGEGTDFWTWLNNGKIASSFVDDVNTAYSNLTDSIKTQKDEYASMQGELDGLEKSFENYGRVVSQIDDLQKAYAEGNTDLMNQRVQEIEWGLKTATTTNSEELAKQYKDNAAAYQADLNLFRHKEAGKTAAYMLNSAQRTKASLEELKKSGANLPGLDLQLMAIDNAISAWKARAEKEAADLTKNYSDATEKGAEEGAEKAADKVKDVVSGSGILGMNADGSVGYNNMYDASAYTMQGGSDGLLDNKDLMTDAMSDVDESVLAQNQKDLDWSSPSKVFMRIGKYLVQGFALGINDNMNLPILAASRMAQMTIGAVRSAIANQGKVGIKPIVDLSAIQNGSIQGMLNGQALALNGNVSSQIAASINSTEFEAQMDRISDQLAAMHNDMITIGNYTNKGLSQLGTTINGMKVVMNTGALVGQIAAPMDTALGNRAILKKRGI